ncbi:MAG TPA: RNA polymerase sigma-70 factor [Chitinophagaceae bacterium]|nr:RNA polymerase sigma-70 factor [Chitinophagaceae bacterium]
MNTSKPPSVFSMQAFQSGEHEAYSTVFKQYYPALCFFAVRLIQNVAAAEDIAQESLIKLWEKHAGFNSPHAIKSFLYITARNACYNFLKRSQTGTKNQSQWSFLWEDADDYVWNQLTRSEVVREVQLMISSLPPECRKVMQHSIVDGMENHEIAQLLKISVHTVKNQKARAIYLMKKKFGNKPLFVAALVLLDMRTSHFESMQQMQQYSSGATYTNNQHIQEPASTYHVQPAVALRQEQHSSRCASYTV